MSDITFDMKILKLSDEIDVESALSGFDNAQSYFTCLNEFMESYEANITKYSAYRITTRSEARKGFLQDMKKLRETLFSLGMKGIALDVKYLEGAAANNDETVLEREISEFLNRMKRMERFVSSARVTQDDTSKPSLPIVLAVDDMPALLTTVAKMLNEKYTVMAVTSARAALKVIEKHTPALFLLDIEMPVMDGYELAAIIRTHTKFKNTPIIFLTAKNSRDDVMSAIKHGGNDYIVKPVDKHLLLTKIERQLGL